MKTKNVVVLLSIVAVWLLTASSTLALSSAPDTSSPAEQLATSSPGVRLNEVQARPASGQHQWVELYRPGTQYGLLYLPLVLKGSGQVGQSAGAAASPSPAAEPNPDISGWQVSNQSGGNYTIPDALPPVPPGCFVLIYFDGLGPGADDYDSRRRPRCVAFPRNGYLRPGRRSGRTLHRHDAQSRRPSGTSWPTARRRVTRRTMQLPPGCGRRTGGSISVSAPAHRTLPRRLPAIDPSASTLATPTCLPLTGPCMLQPIRRRARSNPVPRATWSTVGDGATMASDGFALGWMLVPGATYQLQIDDDPAFGSPLVDITLTQPYYAPASPLPGAVFWWRVRANLGQWQAAWSTPIRVTVVPVTGFQAAGDTAEALSIGPDVELSMTWLRQRKDNPAAVSRWRQRGQPGRAQPQGDMGRGAPGRDLHARPE